MRKLADEVAEDPTTEATLKARAARLGTILDWARDGLPGSVKVEDTFVLRARAFHERAKTPEACRQIDGAILALRDLTDGRLLLATPTGKESSHPRLFLTAAELPALRVKAKGTGREIFASLEKALDGELRTYEPMTPGEAAKAVDLDPLRGTAASRRSLPSRR